MAKSESTDSQKLVDELENKAAITSKFPSFYYYDKQNVGNIIKNDINVGSILVNDINISVINIKHENEIFTSEMVEALTHMSFEVPEQFTDGTKTLDEFYFYCSTSSDQEVKTMGESLITYLAYTNDY